MCRGLRGSKAQEANRREGSRNGIAPPLFQDSEKRTILSEDEEGITHSARISFDGKRAEPKGGELVLAVGGPVSAACVFGEEGNQEEPPRAAAAESLIFLSAVQGNPLCMVVDVHKRRSKKLFSSPKTKWQLNAWLISPGTSTYLCRKKGKSKKDYRFSMGKKWSSCTNTTWPTTTPSP